jgi:phage terminase small subunit
MARGPQRLGAFARELAAGKKPLDAALAAGYPDSNCAPRNARRRAARADVKAMVAELRAPLVDKLEITLSLLIERADMIFRQAMAAGQFNAAISALKELGVLSGKRVERSERGGPGEFDHMSDEELRAAVTEEAIAMGFRPPDETQH